MNNMPRQFPEKGISEEEILKVLASKEKLLGRYSPYMFRIQTTNPLPLALEVLQKFSFFSKNNIGTHTRGSHTNAPHHEIEREVISMIANLFGTSFDRIDGYLTQGGTEGNIMGAWIARNYLRRNPNNTNRNSEIRILKTCLTHYSIDKAADLLDIRAIDISLDQHFGMDPAALKKSIEKNTDEGYKNFILMLTLGYSATGTIDPIQEINIVINKIKKERDVRIYVHLDAAFGGLIHPFIAKAPINFHLLSLDSISIDFHKTGLLPPTTGVFLCSKNMQKWVERPANYLRYGLDDTLSGSRPAANAFAAWTVINFMGKKGFKNMAEYCLELKKHLCLLLAKYKQEIPNDFISHPEMTIAAVHFQKIPNGKLPKYLEKKYNLVGFSMPSKDKQKKYYRISFMPHMTNASIEEFVADLSSINI